MTRGGSRLFRTPCPCRFRETENCRASGVPERPRVVRMGCNREILPTALCAPANQPYRQGGFQHHDEDGEKPSMHAVIPVFGVAMGHVEPHLVRVKRRPTTPLPRAGKRSYIITTIN